MGIHSYIAGLLRPFTAASFANRKVMPDKAWVESQRKRIVQEISRTLEMPIGESEKGLTRWALELKRERPSLYRYLADEKNFDLLESDLTNEIRNIFSHKMFSDRKRVDYAGVGELLEEFKRGTSSILASLRRRFDIVSRYEDMPMEEKIKHMPRAEFSKQMQPMFKMSASSLRQYLLNHLQIPPERWVVMVRNMYSRGNYAEAEVKMRNHKSGLDMVLESLDRLPLPLQKILKAQNDSDLKELLSETIAGMDATKMKSQFSEYVAVFKDLRGRVEQAVYLRQDISESLYAVTRAYEIRNPEDLSERMGRLLLSRSYLALQKLVEERVNKGNTESMARKMEKISPTLAHIVRFAKTHPEKMHMPTLAKDYKRELDQAAVADFRSSPEKVAQAIMKNRLGPMEEKGFDFSKYITTNQGMLTLRILRESILDSLMGQKNNLIDSVMNSSELQKKLKKQAYREDGEKITKLIRDLAEKRFDTAMREQVLETIRQKGGSLHKVLGDREMKGFLESTRSQYFKYSVEGMWDQMHEESKKQTADTERKMTFTVDAYTRNLTGNRYLGKLFKKYKLTTLNDLKMEIEHELKIRHEHGRGGLNLTKEILNLSKIRGRARLENFIVFREIDKILSDNDRNIELYITGKDADTSHINQGTPRKGRSRQATEGRRKEFDPDAQRKAEEKRTAKFMRSYAREKSPSVRILEEMMRSTMKREGMERNKMLEALRVSSYEGFEQQGYTGEKLDEMVNKTMKLYQRRLRNAVFKEIDKDPVMKKARKQANLVKYVNRYMEVRDLFTRQDGRMSGVRNDAITQEKDRLAAQELYFRESQDFTAHDPEAMFQSFQRMGKSRSETGYVERNPKASIPTLIENATTLDELNQIQDFINDRIPYRKLATIERQTGMQPSYTATVGGKEVTVHSLHEFMDIHATRIDPKWTTRGRIMEKEGIINAGGTPI